MTTCDCSVLPGDGNDPQQSVNRYRVQQYELHAKWYEVEAADRGEAVVKLFTDGGTAVESDSDDGFRELAMEYGMHLDDDPELEDELRAAGVRLDDGRLLGIGDIELIPRAVANPAL